MAYDEFLADRIRQILERKAIPHKELKMMGGLCFMVDAKMCVGIIKNDLMARIDPEIYAELLSREGVQEMTFTGRPLKGFVLVKPEVLDQDDVLLNWIELCLEFNPKAKGKRKK